jgi:tetratricopeptide (TPR) repeat protein
MSTPNQTGAGGEKPRTGAARFGWWFAAVLLAYVAISAGSLQAPYFPLDDKGELYLVRTTGSWWSLLGPDLFHFFRPIKNLMFAAYDWLGRHGGMAAVRSMTVMLGLGSAVAVFGLCRRLLASRGWALVATAIWLLAPTMVSCTAWLSASNILVMTGLAAAALSCHDLACVAATPRTDGMKQPSGWWVALALLCLFLSLVSYEGAIGALPLFLAMDVYLHPERLLRRKTWCFYLAYGLVVALYLGLRHEFGSAQRVHGSLSAVSPLQIACVSGYFTALHTGIWLWPFGRLAVIGAYYAGQLPPVVLAGYALLILAAAALALGWRRRFPLFSLGILWFLLAFAPMSNVLGFGNGPYGDYYLALPSIGAAVALTALLRAWQPTGPPRIQRTLALAATALLLAWRGAAAIEAAAWSCVWNQPQAVYEYNLRTFPQAFSVMSELAKYHVARAEYRQADELATATIKLAPDYPEAYAIHAVVAEAQDRIPDALKWVGIYDEKLKTQDAWAATFEADIYADHLGQPERAEPLYRKAIARRPWTPDSVRAAESLAFMMATHGHRDEAIALWEETLTYEPDSFIHHDLALAYAAKGDQKRAAEHERLAQTKATTP